MFTVTFNTDGAAFDGTVDEANAEIARILQVVAQKVLDGQVSGDVLDINGNSRGTFELRGC